MSPIVSYTLLFSIAENRAAPRSTRKCQRGLKDGKPLNFHLQVLRAEVRSLRCPRNQCHPRSLRTQTLPQDVSRELYRARPSSLTVSYPSLELDHCSTASRRSLRLLVLTARGR